MDRISLLIRTMMLRHPNLYPNRFDAFTELMTNSCYAWNRDGSLGEVFKMQKATPDSMVKQYRDELAKRVAEYGPRRKIEPDDLYHRFILEDQKKLHDAEFIAANIDTYASQYTECGAVEVIWPFLWRLERHGISEYWAVNNKPANIAEDWRLAIRGWFSEIIPPMNGLMGINLPEKWVAVERYAKVFDWVMDTYHSYETEADREKGRKMAELAREIVAELKEEESHAK